MRRSSPQYVTVSPTPTTVEIHSAFCVCMILVSPITVGHPVYFRVDGATAAIATNGNQCVVGIGGQATADTDDLDGNVSVSLVSEGTGVVLITPVEMV